jgi:hypothetical protein
LILVAGCGGLDGTWWAGTPLAEETKTNSDISDEGHTVSCFYNHINILSRTFTSDG